MSVKVSAEVGIGSLVEVLFWRDDGGKESNFEVQSRRQEESL